MTEECQFALADSYVHERAHVRVCLARCVSCVARLRIHVQPQPSERMGVPSLIRAIPLVGHDASTDCTTSLKRAVFLDPLYVQVISAFAPMYLAVLAGCLLVFFGGFLQLLTKVKQSFSPPPCHTLQSHHPVTHMDL